MHSGLQRRQALLQQRRNKYYTAQQVPAAATDMVSPLVAYVIVSPSPPAKWPL